MKNEELIMKDCRWWYILILNSSFLIPHLKSMGLFSFTQEIAMDLGTANSIIITNGKIVVDEPSVVALDRRTDKRQS